MPCLQHGSALQHEIWPQAKTETHKEEEEEEEEEETQSVEMALHKRAKQYLRSSVIQQQGVSACQRIAAAPNFCAILRTPLASLDINPRPTTCATQ